MRASSVSLSHHTFDSEVLGNSRSVWLQPPHGDTEGAGLAIFLDGEYYVTHLEAPQLMAA